MPSMGPSFPLKYDLTSGGMELRVEKGLPPSSSAAPLRPDTHSVGAVPLPAAAVVAVAVAAAPELRGRGGLFPLDCPAEEEEEEEEEEAEEEVIFLREPPEDAEVPVLVRRVGPPLMDRDRRLPCPPPLLLLEPLPVSLRSDRSCMPSSRLALALILFLPL